MDTEIPLPGGQHMLPPRVEARLLQALNVARHEKVLEIGTGSGFMAALLGHRAQRVFSLESNPELVALAKENLRRSGVRNVVVQAQDGLAGLPGEAPFDAILLSGSVAEVPAQLLNQLKVGGRLLAIVGDAPVMRATLVTRQADKQFNSVVLFDTSAPRLQGFAEHSSFSF